MNQANVPSQSFACRSPRTLVLRNTRWLHSDVVRAPTTGGAEVAGPLGGGRCIDEV